MLRVPFEKITKGEWKLSNGKTLTWDTVLGNLRARTLAKATVKKTLATIRDNVTQPVTMKAAFPADKINELNTLQADMTRQYVKLPKVRPPKPAPVLGTADVLPESKQAEEPAPRPTVMLQTDKIVNEGVTSALAEAMAKPNVPPAAPAPTTEVKKPSIRPLAPRPTPVTAKTEPKPAPDKPVAESPTMPESGLKEKLASAKQRLARALKMARSRPSPASFRTLQDELTLIKTEVGDANALRDSISNLNGELKTAQEKLTEAETKLKEQSGASGLLEKARENMLKAKEESEGLTTKLKETQAELKAALAKVAVEDYVGKMETELASVLLDWKSVTSSITELTAKGDKLSAKMAELREDLAGYQGDITKTSQYYRVRMKEEAHNYRAKVLKDHPGFARSLARLKELKAAQADPEAIAEVRELIQARSAPLVQKLRKDTLVELKAAKAGETTAIQTTIDKIETRLNAVRAEINLINQLLLELEQKKSDLTARADSLRGEAGKIRAEQIGRMSGIYSRLDNMAVAVSTVLPENKS
ncbi:MAG: hypothetical protein PHG97_01675 [Candidatus Margulisbacteria bacterium]|nr:hypothetical protein [Candidatus Margulisiibacteriota bacterium]